MAKFSIKHNLIFFVLCLTIPMFGMGGYFLVNVWQDLNVIEKRQQGQSILEETWPILVAKIKGQPVADIPTLDGAAYPEFATCFTQAGEVKKKVEVNGETVRKVVRIDPIEKISTSKIPGFFRCVGETAQLLQTTDRGQLFLADQTIEKLPEVAVRLNAVIRSARSFAKKDELGGPAKMMLYVHAGGYKSVADRVSRIIKDYEPLGLNPEEHIVELSKTFGKFNGRTQGSIVGYGRQLEKVKSSAELDRSKLETAYKGYVVAIDDLWVSFAKMANTERQAEIDVLHKNSMILIGGLLFLVMFATGIAVLVYATIMRKVTSLDTGIRAMANDNNPEGLMGELPYAKANDEIGKIAQAVGFFRDSVVKRMKRDEETAREQAGKERQQQVDEVVEEFREKTTELLHSTESSIKEMDMTSNTLHDAAQNTSGLVASVSRASNESSSNVQTVAAAAEEMAASIVSISEQATEVTKIVKVASSKAADTNSDIKVLSENTVSIGEIVEMIRAIAEQTNLLALNATIEAARAGDAGKGFAVVATEVKALASQTANATERISHGVQDIQSYTGRVVEAMQDIVGTMENAKVHAESITDVLDQQRETTNEISESVGFAYEETQQVEQHVGEVGTAAERTNEAADTVRKASDEVADHTSAMRDEVNNFLKRVASI